jgi:teichuronic acid biosynthesis glycosyltransferase TuaH
VPCGGGTTSAGSARSRSRPLPGYLRMMDVGLVPYRDSPFNRGSFPLKTLE